MKAAIYARVSSDRQELEETVQSQLAELRLRLQEDGILVWQEFVDEGYGRDNLVRPKLDPLRDLVAQGDLERLYVQSPDRLASGAKLVLLVEEFQQRCVDVIFLKGSTEDTPEGKLLLHMQGAIAEFERTKIAERTRRGKLYWARQGAMVGGHAPYGYRFVRRTDTQRARLEVDDYQASVVRDMYRWLVEERLSTRAIAKRLTERGILTSRGAFQWQPTAVDRILRNPTYKGAFYYQRTESVAPTRRLTTDPYQRHRKTGRKARPEEDWIQIPVTAIVEEGVWNAGQEQLRQNSLYSRRNNKRHQYLLRGLIRCPRCGSTYSGYTQHGSRGYRCTNASPVSSSTGKRCPPGAISAGPVEDAVWNALAEALRRPDLLVEEYQRQVAQLEPSDQLALERKQVALALKRTKAQENRVTDAYINEAMELDRYSVEMEKLRQRRRELENGCREIDRREQQLCNSKSALDHLDRFCQQVAQGLEVMSFEERQQLLRLVVERVRVEDHRVVVETILPPCEGDKLRTHRGELVEP